MTSKSDSSALARLGWLLDRGAAGLAFCGGVVLVAIAVTTVISIIGRALIPIGLAPIRGDFELVEIGVAVAVFGFLPWCQLHRGHITVDVFLINAPRRVWNLTTLTGDIAITVVALIITWRMWLGLGDKLSTSETTFALGIPVWIGYAIAMIGAVFFCLVSLYTVWRDVNDLTRSTAPR